MAINDADLSVLSNLATSTAIMIDLNRWQEISYLIECNLKQAYELGRNYPNENALNRLGKSNG